MDQDVFPQKKLPGTLDSGIVYTITALFFTYISSRLALLKIPGDYTLILAEVLLIALPPLVWAKARKLDIAKTFRFKLPRPLEVLIMLIISPVMIITAMSAGFIALVLIKKAFGSVLLGGDIPNMMNNGILWSLFLIGVVPAVCEEILFRGLIQRGTERLGAGWSIFLSGMLFGLFHFDFQRLAAQTLIGFIAAYAVYRTGSIFNGMILHFMNNGLLTLLVSLSTRNAPGNQTQPSVMDPFNNPELIEMARGYGMTMDQFLTSALAVFAVILFAGLFVIFGLCIVLRAITRKTVEKPERLRGSVKGLIAGIPGLALILMVYAAIGLTLLGNPAGRDILRILGIA